MHFTAVITQIELIIIYIRCINNKYDIHVLDYKKRPSILHKQQMRPREERKGEMGERNPRRKGQVVWPLHTNKLEGKVYIRLVLSCRDVRFKSLLRTDRWPSIKIECN